MFKGVCPVSSTAATGRRAVGDMGGFLVLCARLWVAEQHFNSTQVRTRLSVASSPLKCTYLGCKVDARHKGVEKSATPWMVTDSEKGLLSTVRYIGIGVGVGNACL